MSSSTEMPRHVPLFDRSASSAGRALLRRSSTTNKRAFAISHTSHVTPGLTRAQSQIETHFHDKTGGILKDRDHMSNSESCDNHGTNENATDEGESTAEEITCSVDSSATTDNFPESIDPIDFIDNNPRPTHSLHPHGVLNNGGSDRHKYENWSTHVSERDLEELARKNSVKRSKASRGGGKIERQRPPHPLPRLTKVKPVRTTVTTRKRRLSGRLARPPQLSNASEEGDMAQADEMGEGEGRDDGFVDGGEAIRKRNRKKPGGVHMLLPNGSPQSSPSTTPNPRRRKSRPKPRAKKPSKLAQLASADISTQESTTQGPGSSDSSEESVSPHEGALRPTEDFADSANEDSCEDTRSLTPHPRDLPTSNPGNHMDSSTVSELPVSQDLDHVADMSNPLPLLHMSSKDSRHSNSDENIHDSNETSDTDFRDSFRDVQWKNPKFESDFSTAPFSSETSDMDTSGNERFPKSDSRFIAQRNGPSKEGTSPRVEHHQINSESSGDEVARRARDVKILPRPPPKPVLQSNTTNRAGQLAHKAPPTAKKPAYLLKNLPMTAGKPINSAAPVPSKTTPTPTRSRGSVKGGIPSKPKPPVAVKPKTEMKARQAAVSTQQTTSAGSHSSSGVLTNGKPAMNRGDSSTTRPTPGSPVLRKIQSDLDIKKPPPPVVATRPLRVSEPQRVAREPGRAMPPVPPAKPSVSPKPIKERSSKLSPADSPPTPASVCSEDTSKNTSSSSETLSSQSPSNSPYASPAVKKKHPPKNEVNTSTNLPSKPVPVDHSQSSPVLPTRQLPPSASSPVLPTRQLPSPASSPVLPARQLPPPTKPPKDLERRGGVVMKTRAQPTPNGSSTDSPRNTVDQSQSVSAASLTNGIQSPSPPPIPPRVRDSQMDLVVPPVKDRQTPSPTANRSNRRPPPEPPRNASPVPSARKQRSLEVDDPPPVPPHGGKRLGSYSKSFSLTQINTIKENYEVCDIDEEQDTSQVNSGGVRAAEAAETTGELDRTGVADFGGDVGSDSTRGKKKFSTTRRTPPRPPMEDHFGEIIESNGAVPPPVQSSPSFPPKRTRPHSHSAQTEHSISHNHSSPVLGSRQHRRSSPGSILTSVHETPRTNAPEPKRPFQRARRDYEEIDIFEDPGKTTSEVPLPLEKPVYKNLPIRKPARRNYEEIDIFEFTNELQSDSSAPDLLPSDSTEPDTPVSPIMMVAVTRQTSASTLKFNSTQIPTLPVEDLRENWANPLLSSPQLTRRPAKSFSIKRGKSMICRRSCSDQFVISKGTTLDPKLIRNGFHRTPSLDNLNDRMDRTSRISIPRETSSSEDDEPNVLSPVQIELPKPPVEEQLYSSISPRTVQKEKEKMEKTFNVNHDAEPLYQYINTAEFLRENPSSEGSKSNGYAYSKGKHSQLEVARQLSQRRLWCEQPEVIKSGVLDILSDEERKLQEAIFEVIISEATYLRSLDVLIKHFMEDPGMNPHLPEGRRVMDKRQHHVIFSNVREVREVSARFLEELQGRQRESAVVRNISDIILNYADNHFDCYVSYCTNQVYQTREMQECLENNTMFREYLRRLEKNKACQNLNMQSFLLLPMQRITRLPLLVLAILNRTPLDHPDHHVVERTLRTVQKLVTSCNDGARKMERTEQLVEIHKRLEFGKLKPFPLVSASRQLERKGTLVELQVEQKLLGKIKVKKTPLYVFVFTDYVIITKKKKDPKGECLYKVIDHASRALVEVEWIETHRGVNFEKQVFGEAESVSRATWAVSQASEKHAFLVILLSNAYKQCAKYLFLAQNDTDKTRWMESMERQDVQKDEEKIYQMWDCPQVQAIFDYRGQQPDELDLQRGDVVKVYRKMADGWYEGERLRDLRRGWFPSNFSIEIESEHTRARNLRETHRLRDLTDSLQSRIQGIKS